MQDLVRGKVCTWLGSDDGHKLYIKAANETEIRNLLSSYTDSEMGEWFSLMTSLALAQTMMLSGMRWKTLTPSEPVILKVYPSLQELREMFESA